MIEQIFHDDMPLYQQILEVILNLSFLKNFTIPPPEKAYVGNEPNLVWEKGIVVDQDVYTRKEYEYHRYEVLLLLLSCLSSPIFTSQEEIQSNVDISHNWIDYIVKEDGSKSPLWNTLFISLFNLVLRFDPVGWGVPYNYKFYNDIRERLMNVSIQLLCIFLNYKVVVNQQPPHYSQSFPDEFPELEQPQVDNRVVSLVWGLEDKDRKLIFEGMIRILENPAYTSKAVLPGSTRPVSVVDEALILIWVMMQTDRKFVRFITSDAGISSLVYAMAFKINDGKNDEESFGTTQLCACILLYLSGERDVCISLSNRFNKTVIGDIPEFTGTFGDYVVLALSDVLLAGKEFLKPVESVLYTSLVNISPYLKTTCSLTAERLLALFDLSLENNDGNVQRYTLESLANILQYQYPGNNWVALLILEREEKFLNLLKEYNDNEVDRSREYLILSTITRFIVGVGRKLPQRDNRTKIMAYLSKITLVGLLPLPHELSIRHYSATEESLFFQYKLMWGFIFTKHVEDLGLFNVDQPRLFKAIQIIPTESKETSPEESPTQQNAEGLNETHDKSESDDEVELKEEDEEKIEPEEPSVSREQVIEKSDNNDNKEMESEVVQEVALPDEEEACEDDTEAPSPEDTVTVENTDQKDENVEDDSKVPIPEDAVDNMNQDDNTNPESKDE